MIKKYSLFFILLLLWGCEKDFTNTVDTIITPFQVVNIYTPAEYEYNLSQPYIKISLELNNVSDVSSVYCFIYDADKKKLNNTPFYLYDNGSESHGDLTRGDLIFSNLFTLQQNYSSGNFQIVYFVEKKDGSTILISKGNFFFKNCDGNTPPLISNIEAPDSIQVQAPKSVFVVRVKAEDSNGLNNVESVYFISYRPDGSSSGNKIQMYDNGDINNHGDLIGGDGIYSTLVEVLPTNVKGTYRFEFQARDRCFSLSNLIVHFITLL